MHNIFPERVRDHLRATWGEPAAVARLSGLSGAHVWRVRWAQHSVVVKATRKQQELVFYERVAPRLRAQHVPLPQLEWSVHEPDLAWMVLEDIPLPLPHTRSLADPEQMAVLRRLHGAAGLDASDLHDAFVPQWTEHMTDAALAWFPAHTAAALRPILQTIRRLAQPLFVPRFPLSGDPNPTNWGLRRDNSLVLYDWERFGWGTPALDVAITIPGLGDPGAFRKMAACYLATDERAAVAQLTQHIGLAKVWSLVEFLSMFVGERNAPPTIAYLQLAFPLWLHHLASTID